MTNKVHHIMCITGGGYKVKGANIRFGSPSFVIGGTEQHTKNKRENKKQCNNNVVDNRFGKHRGEKKNSLNFCLPEKLKNSFFFFFFFFLDVFIIAFFSCVVIGMMVFNSFLNESKEPKEKRLEKKKKTTGGGKGKRGGERGERETRKTLF